MPPTLLPLIRELARQGLDMPAEPPPHRARTGETRFELERLRGLADAVLNGGTHAAPEIPTPPAGGTLRVVDSLGHHRGVYALLAAELCRRAGHPAPPPLTDPETVGVADADPATADAWHAYRAAVLDLPEASAGASVEPTVDTPAGSMQHPDPYAAADTWVFNDLVRLHAAALRGPSDRVDRAIDYHVHHTQPDYTTYQPWALAAFAATDAGRSFAEQQIHDVATHFAVVGPRGALVPALLLTLAADTLAEAASD